MTTAAAPPTSKPSAVRVDPEGIPEELRAIPRWMLWRWTWDGTKWTKPPFVCDGKSHASSTNSATWASFDEVMAAYLDASRGFDGIGFALTEDDDVAGVDLDHVYDPTTGTLEPWAQSVVDRLASYSEISPSNTGIRVLVHAPSAPAAGRKSDQIEMYSTGRYLTFTGQHLAGTPATIKHRDEEYLAERDRAFPPKAAPPATSTGSSALDDGEVLRRAFEAKNGAKVLALYASGDVSLHGSDHSAADLALVGCLAFWTQDRAQLDRLFRRSGLYREKWDERHAGDGTTYGAMTIDAALSALGDTWGGEEASPGRLVAPRQSPAVEPQRTNLDPWPEPPGPAAYSGLVGEIVEAACAVSEADPVAVLANLLLAFGAALGPGPHALVGGTKHPAREFFIVAGNSSKARKGDARNIAQRFILAALPSFADNTHSGLSTGEGLLQQVRDPVESDVVDKKTGETKRVVTDKGVFDKRLLVHEPEFARLLRASSRQGNTLSQILRDAWDGRARLEVMTRSAPIVATDTHIVVGGDITIEELKRELTDTEIANGFVNRFPLVAARRAKELPEPDVLSEATLSRLGHALFECIQFGRLVGCMSRDEAASALWRAVYHDLSDDRPGLFGKIVARAEAHVLRLSLLYALLDKSDAVRAEHLLSALEVWAYCERSAEYIFGATLGYPTADLILTSLRRGELDSTAVNRLFSGHTKSEEIEAALDYLVTHGLVEKEPINTGGRPRTIWRAR